MAMRYFVFGLLYVCLSSVAFGQIQDSLSNNIELGQAVNPDSTATITQTKKRRNGVLSMFAGNPGKAALYSLMLPGAGQFYNKKYLKVPIVVGVEGAIIGLVVRNNQQYKRWDSALTDKLNNVPNSDADTRSEEELFSIRDRARRNRDISLISGILVHLFQVADAFIHRHLIEFDVSDDLSFEWGAPDSGFGLGLTITF